MTGPGASSSSAPRGDGGGEPSSLKGAVAVVTGGVGYVGRKLCLALVKAGCREVRSIDVGAPPPGVAIPGVRDFAVDVGGDFEPLLAAIRGASVVFHLASYGMSGGAVG